METGDDNDENTGDPNHENMLEGSSNIDQDGIIDTIDSFDFSQCCEQLISKMPKVQKSAVELSSVQLLASVLFEVEKYIAAEMIHSERNPLMW